MTTCSLSIRATAAMDALNTARSTLTSTILATVLALAAAPASAHCPHNGNENHKHCDTGGGGGGGGGDTSLANPAIAFVNSGLFTSGQMPLMVMDADGSSQTVVLDSPGGGFISSPSWSPDGKFLALSASDNILGCGGVGLVELLDVGTNQWSTPISLVRVGGAWATPAFSPVQDGNTYKLAYFGRENIVPLPGGRVTEELVIVTVTAPDIGSVAVGTPVNISNTPGVGETEPSWSPSGDEIVVAARDISANPDEPSTWVRDYAIYNADGSGRPTSLLRGNPDFPAETVHRTDSADWAKTNEDMILFSLQLVDDDWDIWCIERDTMDAVNVTQHLDDSDRAELNDLQPSWLPDDSGFVFSRDSGAEIVEMTFGNGYDPANGCPTDQQLAAATASVLAKAKGRKDLISADYWRNAAP